MRFSGLCWLTFNKEETILSFIFENNIPEKGSISDILYTTAVRTEFLSNFVWYYKNFDFVFRFKSFKNWKLRNCIAAFNFKLFEIKIIRKQYKFINKQKFIINFETGSDSGLRRWYCFPFSLFLVHKLKIVSGKFQSSENLLGSI